jgi:O-antigen ligase
MALAAGIAVTPVLAYVAFKRPLVFPFAAYVALIPFDNLLQIPKYGTLTKLMAILSGLAFVFYLVRTKKIIKPGAQVAFWFAVTLWAAATLAWTIDLDASLPLFATLVQLFLLYTITVCMPVTKEDLAVVLGAAVVGSAAASVYAWHLFSHGIDVSKGARLYISTDTNTLDPNQFALSLMLPIAVVTIGFLSTRRLRTKLIYLAFMAVFGAGIVTTGSRGSMLAIVAMFLFFFWKSRFRKQLLPLMIAGSLGSLALIPMILARWSLASSTGGAGRMSIWHVAMGAMKQYWLAGAGVGGFPEAYDRFYLSVFQEYNARWHRGSHSLIVGTAVELGVIGLALMLFAWLKQYRVLSAFTRRNANSDVAVCLQATMVALFVGALFLDIMYQKYTWFVFIAVALARNLLSQSAASQTPLVPMQRHPILVQQIPRVVPVPISAK